MPRVPAGPILPPGRIKHSRLPHRTPARPAIRRWTRTIRNMRCRLTGRPLQSAGQPVPGRPDGLREPVRLQHLEPRCAAGRPTLRRPPVSRRTARSVRRPPRGVPAAAGRHARRTRAWRPPRRPGGAVRPYGGPSTRPRRGPGTRSAAVPCPGRPESASGRGQPLSSTAVLTCRPHLWSSTVMAGTRAAVRRSSRRSCRPARPSPRRPASGPPTGTCDVSSAVRGAARTAPGSAARHPCIPRCGS